MEQEDETESRRFRDVLLCDVVLLLKIIYRASYKYGSAKQDAYSYISGKI